MQKFALWAASMEGLVFLLTVLVTALAVALAGFVSNYYRGRSVAARKFSEMEKKIDYLEHAMWDLTDAEVRRTWKNQHKQWGGGSAPKAFCEKPEAPARVLTSEEPSVPFVGSYRTAAPREEPAVTSTVPTSARQWSKRIGPAMAVVGMIVVCAGWPGHTASTVGWALLASGAGLFLGSAATSWSFHPK